MIKDGSYHLKNFFQADPELEKLQLNVTIGSPSDCCVVSSCKPGYSASISVKIHRAITAVKASEFHW